MADYDYNGIFIVEENGIVNNHDGTFTVYFNVYDAADTAKSRKLFAKAATYDGDQAAFETKLQNALNRLQDSALAAAKSEIASVLGALMTPL